MMKKTKIGLLLIIPVILTGGYLFYPSSLPACGNEPQINLNLTKMFVGQIEDAGAQVIGLNIQNTVDHHDKAADIRFCASTVNFRVKQNEIEQRFSYQTEFHIKWNNKEERAYYIELLKLIPLTSREDQFQKDLGELTAGFKGVSFHSNSHLPILKTSLYPTPSLQLISEKTEDVIHHDIIFFAATEDNDGFVTLFKENDHTIFILGGKDGINYRYVVPKLEPTSSAGGSLYFEDDGVGYKLTADKKGGMTLHIHDNSGYYQVPLNTTNEQYINRIPPIANP